MSKLWLIKWWQSLIIYNRKFEQWLLTRGFLKQHLTEKQNGYLQSGRLLEVVASEKWSLEKS